MRHSSPAITAKFFARRRESDGSLTVITCFGHCLSLDSATARILLDIESGTSREDIEADVEDILALPSEQISSYVSSALSLLEVAGLVEMSDVDTRKGEGGD